MGIAQIVRLVKYVRPPEPSSIRGTANITTRTTSQPRFSHNVRAFTSPLRDGAFPYWYCFQSRNILLDRARRRWSDTSPAPAAQTCENPLNKLRCLED